MIQRLLPTPLLVLPLLAHAQATDLDLSVGLKTWNTQWTTWGYANNGTVISQAPARDRTVLIPLLNVRYRNLVGSISEFRATDYELLDGSTNRRKEFDLNLGWLLTPGLAARAGYKKLSQSAGGNFYELAGPTVSASVTAPVHGALSFYGTFGLGWMKETGASNVFFDADYQLSELGLGYAWPLKGVLRAVSLTAGYRIQVLNSREALPGQDARDLTQGFSFAVLAVF